MDLTYALLLAALASGAIWALLRLCIATRVYLSARGQRIIVCPETQQHAAVQLDAFNAASQATAHAPDFRLKSCSRWPERRDCGQECLTQIEDLPFDCLVSTIVNRWYSGKPCIFCQRPFGELHWHDHPPALMNQKHEIMEWKEIPAEKLPEALATHWPVCWNCHIAETFRKEHPELVVDRRPDARRLTIYH